MAASTTTPSLSPPVSSLRECLLVGHNYDGKTQLLIENPINRYLINSPMLPSMKKNPDGSVTIYIQKDTPSAEKKANWLPAPNGPIYMVMRLYWPRKKHRRQSCRAGEGTWKPPAIDVTQVAAVLNLKKDARRSLQDGQPPRLAHLLSQLGSMRRGSSSTCWLVFARVTVSTPFHANRTHTPSSDSSSRRCPRPLPSTPQPKLQSQEPHPSGSRFSDVPVAHLLSSARLESIQQSYRTSRRN